MALQQQGHKQFGYFDTCPDTDLDSIVARLDAIFSAATPQQVADGMAWYAGRHQWLQALGALSGVPTRTLAYAASALSPNTRWDKNETALMAHLTALRTRVKPRTATLYGSGDDKAWDILTRCYPHAAMVARLGQGQKTQAFACNLQELETLPDGAPAVTIDTVTYQAGCGTVPARGIGKQAYRAFVQACCLLAKKHGIAAYQFQAIVWVVWRGSAV